MIDEGAEGGARPLDAMNTAQAAVTWLSTVGFKSHQGDHFVFKIGDFRVTLRDPGMGFEVEVPAGAGGRSAYGRPDSESVIGLRVAGHRRYTLSPGPGAGWGG